MKAFKALGEVFETAFRYPYGPYRVPAETILL